MESTEQHTIPHVSRLNDLKLFLDVGIKKAIEVEAVGALLPA